MGNLRQPIIPLFFPTFIFLHLFVTPALAAQAGEETPQFNPPWNQTRERIPQEVKDKEKEAPLAWCENKEKKEFEVTYRDPNTHTQVRIKRREDWSEPRPIQDGRFEIVSGIRFRKSVWEITIDEPGKPRRKITYDPDFYRGETRTEQIGREPPTTRPVREGDLFDPDKVKKGSLPRDLSPNQLARATFRASDPDSPGRSEIVSGYHLPTLLAAALERAETQTPLTQERPPLNVKLVHYGKPQEPPTYHLDPGPKTTPEEFVQKSPPTTWRPEDRDGPTAVAPGPTETPITFLPGGGINVGSGWTSARVPFSFLVNCSGENEEDGGPAQPPAAQRTLDRQIEEAEDRENKAYEEFRKARDKFEEAKEQVEKEAQELTGEKKEILDGQKELVAGAERKLGNALRALDRRQAAFQAIPTKDNFLDVQNAKQDVESAEFDLERAEDGLQDVKLQLVKPETREKLEKAEGDKNIAERILRREAAARETLDLTRRVLRGVRILFGK